jgi:hypothetical protein
VGGGVELGEGVLEVEEELGGRGGGAGGGGMGGLGGRGIGWVGL